MDAFLVIFGPVAGIAFAWWAYITFRGDETAQTPEEQEAWEQQDEEDSWR
jgi:hypothetical protein